MRSTLALTVVALCAPSVANAAITAIYRTNTNNGSITGIAEYASFQALLDRQVTTTYSAIGSERDMFMAVPAPGAVALLGLAGLITRRRR